MTQEWNCTSKAIAQTTIAFGTSTNDVLKTQIWYFISGAVILYDNMLASALDKVVTFAVEIFVERKLPTKLEATLDDAGQADLKNFVH